MPHYERVYACIFQKDKLSDINATFVPRTMCNPNVKKMMDEQNESQRSHDLGSGNDILVATNHVVKPANSVCSGTCSWEDSVGSAAYTV